MEEKTIRRSKIYTYFYGRNTVFQKFLILVGVLFILLSSIAGNANRAGFEKKLDKVREEYYAADTAYDQEYDNLRWELGIRVVRGQEVDVEADDQYKTEKNKYNDALLKFREAQDKYNDMSSKRSSKGFFGGLCTFIGIVSIVAGLGWIIYIKWSINYVGQAEYDAELAERAELAKKKGLEKLNIVAEQIDSIEPVVLDGVGRPAEAVEAVNKLAKLLEKVWRFILSFDNLILGAIAIAIYTAILSGIAKGMGAFVFFFLLTAAGMGYYGYYLYKKYEQNSFVPERVFKRMERLTAVYKTKLGSDDKIRASLPAINVYMFGQEQLYVYTYCFDIVTGEFFAEESEEYFYEDIVGVISEQEIQKLTVGEGFLRLFPRTIRYQKERITIDTKGMHRSQSYLLGMGQSLLDTKFLGMRNLIRQKKNEQ